MPARDKRKIDWAALSRYPAFMPRKKRQPALGDMYTRIPESLPYGSAGLGDDAPEPAPAKKERGHSACGAVLPKSTVQLCLKRTGKTGPQMAGPRDACQLVRSLGDADREHFLAIHLDIGNRVIGVDHVATGSLTGVEVHPREVFKSALLNNAAGVLFAHNHPSSQEVASSADITLTKRLKDAGELLGIKVLDHVIVAADACVSFSDKGLLGFEPDYTGEEWKKPVKE